MKTESQLKEIIIGDRYFPTCGCGETMEWLILNRLGEKPQEFLVCPKCNKPELMRLSGNGKVTRFTIERNGVFALG